ncbi:MAG: hypothetical protein K2G55_15405 [Lachnospiraceae bacterium]|nr:hypothetical protein [Lachnospiraceae bacterium]MDE7200355.1 hypothetical protein [Lachnospiraceae bacterium]
MAKSLYFFATKEDLHKIIQKVEQTIQLKYVTNDLYESTRPKIYWSFEEYEDIGVNKSGDQTDNFFIFERNCEIVLRKVPQLGGGVRYSIGQDLNKDSIVFWPGGLYQDQFLIMSHIGTISKSPESLKIYDVFKKAIKKQCHKHQKGGFIWYSDAVEAMSSKYRLITININSPQEYDFVIESED